MTTPHVAPPDGIAQTNRLASSYGALWRTVAHVSSEALEWRPPSGAWTAREHVAHLVRYQDVFLERLRRMLAEDTPRFPRYRAEEDPEFPAVTALPLPALRERADRSRGQLHRLVGRLEARDLARAGEHPVFGAVGIDFWIDFFLAHEGHHTYTILLRARPA